MAVSRGANPPAARLLGIILVGVSLISMAALCGRSSYGPPDTGVFRGGGGGGSVSFPFNPFGPTVQAPPAWPQVYEPPQPGRSYRPDYNPTRNRYLTPYQTPYGNPYGGPNSSPSPYANPSGGGAPRGPGR